MKPGALWPIAIAGVLGLTVAANGFMLYEASRAGAEAIEPDYYQKALRWDSTMAQAERNVALGWRLAARLERDGTVSVQLADRTGAPLAGAVVTLEGFGLAGAEVPYRATLAPDSLGGYAARVPLHAGLNELRFTAIRGGDRYTTVLRGAPGERLVPPA